jgi:hypothetical protein
MKRKHVSCNSKFFFQYLLRKNVKIKIYRTIHTIWPVALYECETRSLTIWTEDVREQMLNAEGNIWT